MEDHHAVFCGCRGSGPIEQKDLEFISTNRDTFLYLSIGQLARALDMSDATVSRFARHVGCRDYKSLKALVMEQSQAQQQMAGTLGRRGRPSLLLPGWSTQQLCLGKTAQQLDEAGSSGA